jgi:hypothetical protein
MKNGFLKTALTLVLLAAMTVTVALPALALPINSDIADNYIYNYNGEPVQAPLAYKAIRVLGYEDLGLDRQFQPSDIYVRGDYLYIVDKGGNRVIVLDQDYQVVSIISELKNAPALYAYIPGKTNSDGSPFQDSEMLSHNKNTFYAPEGIYVDEDGLIYVADTQNRRIVICDIDGNVQSVIQGVRVDVINDYAFKPVKIVVDRTGSFLVIGYAVNRGLLEIDNDGTFRSFVGAPPVTYNAADWFWRVIATEEQKKQLVKYVPTEYSNINIDDRGFIYATISTISAPELMTAIAGNSVSGALAPVKKLSPAGSDVLRRTGKYPPVGDLKFFFNSSPQIVDVAVDDESGRYTIIDSRSGRFFTYDPDGNLLYMGGGSSTDQNGRFRTANSIAIRGEHIIISDVGNKSITVYETTEYARLINSAVSSNAAGRFEEAADYWDKVTTFNSNMYIAYIGLGKAEMRQAMANYDETRFDHYENALVYFSKATEKENYSKAYGELRKEELSKNFSFIFIGIIIIIVGIIVLYFVRKSLKKKKRGAK